MQDSPVPTPLIKLVGFERVKDLSPSGEAVVTVSMDPSQMTVSHVCTVEPLKYMNCNHKFKHVSDISPQWSPD